MAKAQAVLVESASWGDALHKGLEQIAEFGPVDLLFLFISSAYRSNLPDMVEEIYKKSGARVMVGCSGQGIIGEKYEVEDKNALSLLALSLPGIELEPVYFTQAQLNKARNENGIAALTGVSQENVNSWLLLVDPFTIETEQMLACFEKEYPNTPVVGGVASSEYGNRESHLFLNGKMLEEGVVGLAIGGSYHLESIVSQGATPIGETWLVTASDKNIVQKISGRPAFQVLVDTLNSLTPAQQETARRNLLVGLAVNEYKCEFGRGDFLIRSLIGIDPQTGMIAIGDIPRIGQTIQFQLRDAYGAGEDLREMLEITRFNLEDNPPVAGVLFSCNGRGSNMFDIPDHDARTITEQLNSIPLAGFFCNGEIGPVGSKNYLHGFTASLGLFVPNKEKAGD